MIRLFTITILTALAVSRCCGQLETRISQFVQKHNIPGLFVGVVRNDTVIYQHNAGWADREQKTLLSASTCMEIGSLTKALISEVIYLLQEKRLLRVTDSINQYFTGAPASWSSITIQHLLTHSSGIKNYLLDPRFQAAEYFLNTADAETERFFTSLTTDSMVRMFYSLPLEFPPGTSWSYSNTGYYLLGKIAEKVTGKDFFDLLHDFVTAPLQMKRTMFNEKALEQGCLATGYHMRDSALRRSPMLESSYAFTAGALATTGADMLQYLKAIHQRKLPSDKAGFNTRLAPNYTALPYNYNAGRFYTTFHGLQIISHNGGTPGFSSSWIYVPEKNISITLLANRQDFAPLDQLAWDILAGFEPALEYPQQKKEGVMERQIADRVMEMLHAVKNDGPLPVALSKALRIFMDSENGRGYWKWYFDRGFPDTAICVDKEKIAQSVIYRFRLPLPGNVEYRLSVLVNENNEFTQVAWW